MRIAICDDEAYMRERVMSVLLADTAVIPDMSLFEFASGNELIASYNNEQSFDLVMLDVEMPGLNGLQTGEQVRKIDKDVAIVFLTSHKQYVFKSLRIGIYDYLIKPPKANEIHDLLERVYADYIELHHIVNFKWQGQPYALRVNEIVCIEGYSRHVLFHTKNGKYECVGKLDEYEEKLAPYGFLRCHQGFLINMRYIESIEKQTFKTTVGTVVNMSARRRQDCLQAFNNYVVRHQI